MPNPDAEPRKLGKQFVHDVFRLGAPPDPDGVVFALRGDQQLDSRAVLQVLAVGEFRLLGIVIPAFDDLDEDERLIKGIRCAVGSKARLHSPFPNPRRALPCNPLGEMT